MRGSRCLLLAAWLVPRSYAEPGMQPDMTFVPNFQTEQQFHDRVAQSSWHINELAYVDGASSAVLRHPYTILHAAHDELFVASFTLNHVVKLRWLSGKRAQYKVFVSGRDLDGPVGMALQADSLYVASFTNDVVLRINATSGALLSRIGGEDTLDCPEGIAIGPDGILYVASFLLPHLSKFDPISGQFLGKFGTVSSAASAWSTWSMPIPPSSGGMPSLSDLQASAEKRPRPTLSGAEDLTFDLEGNVHVTAYYSNAIFKFNRSSGALSHQYGKGLVHGPVGVTCDPLSGDIFVSSYKDHRVLRFSAAGQFISVAAGAGVEGHARTKGRTSISSPSGLAFAEDGTLWVASYTTGAVTRFNNTAGGARTFWRVTS